MQLAALLLERGANPNAQLKQWRPPFVRLARGQHNTLATGATPLLRAAHASDVAAVIGHRAAVATLESSVVPRRHPAFSRAFPRFRYDCYAACARPGETAMTRQTFNEAPVVETERLVMRANRIEDFPHVAAAWKDPEVVRYIGQPSSEEESWARFLRNGALWRMLGYGYWAVTEKATGRFVGDVGFADFKRDIQPSLKGVPEIGWVLARWSHGRGYATEAAQAALAWLESALGPQRTVCIINDQNRASVRVAEKCGYREFARALYKGATVVMLERP